MAETAKTIHDVHVYTQGGRWTGRLVLAPWQRLSDFLNERGIEFIELEHATLVQWDKASTPTLLRIEQIALSKANAIVVCGATSVRAAREVSPERVIKAQQRVKIVAPPFILTGDYHVPQGADWLNLLNMNPTSPRFLSVTDVSLLALDSALTFADQVEFALVNRQSMVAIGAWG